MPENKERTQSIKEATVALLKARGPNNMEITFRLVSGWPGSQPDELAIFEETPEEQKSITFKGRLLGYAWGPYVKEPAEAKSFLEAQGYKFSEL